jgi:hypothetical protein
LVVVPKQIRGVEIPHTILTNGDAVLAAGEAEVYIGEDYRMRLRINNYSGHYMPSPQSLDIGIRAFARYGIAFGEGGIEPIGEDFS